MKYKHIIFDIDGTMLNSEFADLTALQKVLWELKGRAYEFSELYFALGVPGTVSLAKLDIEDIGKASMLWSRYMNELTYTMTLFDGIHELVVALKNKGVQLGIITSKNKTEYQNDFTRFEIHNCFNTVICVDDCKAPKPSPEPMLSYIQKTGAKQEDLLYIGDTPYDRECAYSAGVDFGLALWGCHYAEQINATYSFRSPEEILSLF